MNKKPQAANNTRRRGVGKARVQHMENIISAAEIEFSQKGFEGVSIQTIADRAGLTKRQVLYFFKTKNNLYQSVIKNIFKEWATIDLYLIKGSPQQVLNTYIERILRSAQKKPHLSKILINEMTRGGEVALSIFRDLKTEETMKSLKERFENWKAEEKIKSIDPIHYIFLIWAAQHFYAAFEPEVKYIMGVKKLKDEDWDNIIEQTKKIFLNILKE